MDSGIDFGFIFGAKMLRKSYQKPFRVLVRFWDDFGFQNGPKMIPKYSKSEILVAMFRSQKRFAKKDLFFYGFWNSPGLPRATFSPSWDHDGRLKPQKFKKLSPTAAFTKAH